MLNGQYLALCLTETTLTQKKSEVYNVKLPPLHGTKAYGEIGIIPLILKLGSMRRVNSQLHGPATSLLVKEPPVQTEKRRGWPLSQPGNFREQNRFPNSPDLSLVIKLTELAWCHIREVCLGN